MSAALQCRSALQRAALLQGGALALLARSHWLSSGAGSLGRRPHGLQQACAWAAAAAGGAAAAAPAAGQQLRSLSSARPAAAAGGKEAELDVIAADVGLARIDG